MILSMPATAHFWTSLLAIAIYAASALGGHRLDAKRSAGLLFVSWIVHGFALWAGLHDDAGVPRFGFAPALSAMAWLVILIYVLENHWYPQFKTRWTLLGLAGCAVTLAALFPGHALPAQTSIWLPLHWMFGIAAYGLFAAAVFHGWLLQRAEHLLRMAEPNDETPPLLTLERLTFRLVSLGFVLLTLTLLIGIGFGEALYGPDFSLKADHKTIFSFLSWFAFAYLLWGRFRLGWRGLKAIRVLYLGSGLLLLSYVGSRFVLEVLLGRIA
jgi:ABC-type uncharacterized transport system permease subunit